MGSKVLSAKAIQPPRANWLRVETAVRWEAMVTKKGSNDGSLAHNWQLLPLESWKQAHVSA